MLRTVLAAAALTAFSASLATPSMAQSGSFEQFEEQAEPVGQGQDRLLIVNGNTGRVVYDDGRDDLFCVTRRVVAYYDHFGRPVHRRTMRCR